MAPSQTNLFQKKRIAIGIAGGSGSGKTTFAKILGRELESRGCQILYQDRYFVDQSKNFDHDGGSVNFDHPDSIEGALLARHITALKKGESVELPIYDFPTHKRLEKTDQADPTPILLVDGILILHYPEVFEALDFSIFVDIPEDVRFERRLSRDTKERGRSPEGVAEQFKNQVAPMHNLYVEPSKTKAGLVIKNDNYEIACEKTLQFVESELT